MSPKEKQEKLQLLRDILDKQDVPKSYYSIGKYCDEAVCIEDVEDGWVVYEGDRGSRYNEKHFEDFFEAGNYFLSRATYNENHRKYLLSSFAKQYKKWQTSPQPIQWKSLALIILVSVAIILCLAIVASLFQTNSIKKQLLPSFDWSIHLLIIIIMTALSVFLLSGANRFSYANLIMVVLYFALIGMFWLHPSQIAYSTLPGESSPTSVSQYPTDISDYPPVEVSLPPEESSPTSVSPHPIEAMPPDNDSTEDMPSVGSGQAGTPEAQWNVSDIIKSYERSNLILRTDIDILDNNLQNTLSYNELLEFRSKIQNKYLQDVNIPDAQDISIPVPTPLPINFQDDLDSLIKENQLLTSIKGEYARTLQRLYNTDLQTESLG